MEKTALEQYFQELENHNNFHGFIDIEAAKNILDEYRELEKQNILNAITAARITGNPFFTGEQYFNQTFNHGTQN